MEEDIARFMLQAAKLEFFLVNYEPCFARRRKIGSLDTVSGVDWGIVSQFVEKKFPFANFKFKDAGFCLFQETSPQYLVITNDKRLKWDSDVEKVDSWEKLFVRSYAQLRNNIAHGNKIQLPAPFTYDRTKEFISAGHSLIAFLTSDVIGVNNWDTPLYFQ